MNGSACTWRDCCKARLTGRDGRWEVGRVRAFALRLQPLLAVLIPEVEGAVAARRYKGTELWVEGHAVDGVDVVVLRTDTAYKIILQVWLSCRL